MLALNVALTLGGCALTIEPGGERRRSRSSIVFPPTAPRRSIRVSPSRSAPERAPPSSSGSSAQDRTRSAIARPGSSWRQAPRRRTSPRSRTPPACTSKARSRNWLSAPSSTRSALFPAARSSDGRFSPASPASGRELGSAASLLSTAAATPTRRSKSSTPPAAARAGSSSGTSWPTTGPACFRAKSSSGRARRRATAR